VLDEKEVDGKVIGKLVELKKLKMPEGKPFWVLTLDKGDTFSTFDANILDKISTDNLVEIKYLISGKYKNIVSISNLGTAKNDFAKKPAPLNPKHEHHWQFAELLRIFNEPTHVVFVCECGVGKIEKFDVHKDEMAKLASQPEVQKKE